jgi:hypothetical protein
MFFSAALCYTHHCHGRLERKNVNAHKVILSIREREPFDQKTRALTVRLACSPHEYTLQTNHDQEFN